MLDTVELSLTLKESAVFEPHGWLDDSPNSMVFFLQAPALQSIKVLSHFFRSHLNPNTRLALRPLYKDFTLATARLVVFLKNGKVLCWKLSIQSLQNLCRNISATRNAKKGPATSSTFLSFLFSTGRTVAFLPRALSRASFDDTMIHATLVVCSLTSEVWNICKMYNWH